jgi:ubiquinone/menaquinone biosynthesis C-methylase UbiE
VVIPHVPENRAAGARHARARAEDRVMGTAVEQLAGVHAYTGAELDELRIVTGESLAPRGPELLFDLFARFDVRPGALVMDLGGRDALDAVQLALRFDCRVLLVDQVGANLDQAADRIREHGLRERIMTDLGQPEALPVKDGDVDFIWCRDVMNRVFLPKAMAECARALRPGGGMLVYQSFATELLEPVEARRLYDALGLIGEYMSAESFERAALQAKLRTIEVERIGSEWRELWLEGGDLDLLDDLLRVARMQRTRDQLIARYGRGRFEAIYASSLWGIYQMLGKLSPAVYRFERPLV